MGRGQHSQEHHHQPTASGSSHPQHLCGLSPHYRQQTCPEFQFSILNLLLVSMVKKKSVKHLSPQTIKHVSSAVLLWPQHAQGTQDQCWPQDAGSREGPGHPHSACGWGRASSCTHTGLPTLLALQGSAPPAHRASCWWHSIPLV